MKIIILVVALIVYSGAALLDTAGLAIKKDLSAIETLTATIFSPLGGK